MNNLFKIFGYAGAVPFLVLAGLAFYFPSSQEEVLNFVAQAQVGYAAIILSFLGGIHWPFSLQPRGKRSQGKMYGKQMSNAMLPSIFGFMALILALSGMEDIALFCCVGLFWMVYVIDQIFLSKSDFPEGYFAFRLNITLIVTIALLATYLGAYT